MQRPGSPGLLLFRRHIGEHADIMAVRKILRMGDALLLQRAAEVQSFGTPWLQELLADMFDTMHAAGGVGLAAPQIGESVRVVVFGFEQNERYPDAPAVPRTILLNPVLTPLGKEEEDGWEGCLSVPGLRGVVPRYRHLRYQGFDPQGAAIDRTVEGFHARVVQHEVDHLDGVLYPMRIRDMTRFGFQDVLFPGQPAGDD
jgi:peptide deformylase